MKQKEEKGSSQTYTTKKNKFRYTIIIIIFLLLDVIFIAYLVVAAKPGNFFYWPKLVIEQSLLSVEDLDEPQSRSNLLTKLENRTSEFVELANSGQCIDALLAEEKAFANLQQAINAYLKINSTASRAAFVQNLDAVIKPTVDVQSSCESTKDWDMIKELTFMQVLAQARQLPVQYETEISLRLQDLDKSLEKLKQQLKAESFTKQDRLDQVNQLFMSSQQLLEKVQQDLAKNEVDEETALEISLLSVRQQQINSLLAQKQEADSSNLEQMLITMCKLDDGSASICEQQALNAQWNSVSSISDIDQRLVAEKDLLKNYFQAIFLRK